MTESPMRRRAREHAEAGIPGYDPQAGAPTSGRPGLTAGGTATVEPPSVRPNEPAPDGQSTPFATQGGK